MPGPGSHPLRSRECLQVHRDCLPLEGSGLSAICRSPAVPQSQNTLEDPGPSAHVQDGGGECSPRCSKIDYVALPPVQKHLSCSERNSGLYQNPSETQVIYQSALRRTPSPSRGGVREERGRMKCRGEQTKPRGTFLAEGAPRALSFLLYRITPQWEPRRWQHRRKKPRRRGHPHGAQAHAPSRAPDGEAQGRARSGHGWTGRSSACQSRCW